MENLSHGPLRDNASFTVGESEPMDRGPIRTSDPLTFAQRVQKHHVGTAQEKVSGAVAFAEGLAAFKSEPDKLQLFLQHLAGLKVITKAEAEKGLTASGAFLSRLKAIGENAGVLQHPKILAFHRGSRLLRAL